MILFCSKSLMKFARTAFFCRIEPTLSFGFSILSGVWFPWWTAERIKDFRRVIKSVLWPWFSHWLLRDLPRGGWGLYDLIWAQIVDNIIAEKYTHVFDLIVDFEWICCDVYFFKFDILIITWYFSLLLFHKASWGRFQRLLFLFDDLNFTLTVAIL